MLPCVCINRLIVRNPKQPTLESRDLSHVLAGFLSSFRFGSIVLSGSREKKTSCISMNTPKLKVLHQSLQSTLDFNCFSFLPFSAKPIRPGQQPSSPSVRPGSTPGIGSALLGMTRLAGGAVMGSNVPNSPSTPSLPSSPNGAAIVTPVIRGGKGSEPIVSYSKRIRNAVSTESLNRPLPQGSPR